MERQRLTRRRFGALLAGGAIALAPTESQAPEIMSAEHLRSIMESKSTLILELREAQKVFDTYLTHIDDEGFYQRGVHLVLPAQNMIAYIQKQISAALDALHDLDMLQFSEQGPTQLLKIKAERAERLYTRAHATIVEFKKEIKTPGSPVKKFWDIMGGVSNI